MNIFVPLDIYWYDYAEGIEIDPDLFIVERVWEGNNPQCGIVVGVSRTALMRAIEAAHSPAFEFTPRQKELEDLICKVKKEN